MSGSAASTLAELDAAIAAAPNDASLRARRAEHLEQLGRYEQALSEYDCALTLRPNYAWALAHRGDLRLRIDRHQLGEVALADLTRALELSPNYIWALAHRGALYKHLRRPAAALRDLDLALALQPDYPWALIYRTEVLVILNRYEHALADALHAVALDPEIFEGWRGEMALLLNYMARWEQSLDFCEQAWRRDPNDAFAWYSASVAVACSRDLAAARKFIDRARPLLEAALVGHKRAGAIYRLGGLAALEGRTEAALTHLHEAGQLDTEAYDLARHDPAWLRLRQHPRLIELVAVEAEP